jgi:hypothetical protein
MSKKIKLLAVSIMAASLAASFVAHAASADGSVACNVAVNTNGAIKGGTYNKAFVVKPGADFIEDFGPSAPFDSFTASIAKVGGNFVMSVGYFRDVSTFDSVGFKANLTIPNGGDIAKTSGSNEFDTSLNGFRSYVTDYSLSCRRQ